MYPQCHSYVHAKRNANIRVPKRSRSMFTAALFCQKPDITQISSIAAWIHCFVCVRWITI